MSSEQRKRLSGAIIAQLSQRQMTINELAEELDHFATRAAVKREVLRLVRKDVVYSKFTTKRGQDTFETWERAIERIKARRRACRQ